ncbi:hypothetical protein JCM33374_g293 [Metschnikowia sp. JCM 33374]|nr:hypothetical protein JCM33374_g293 [Metschnikowia sp. JCM 33374]
MCGWQRSSFLIISIFLTGIQTSLATAMGVLQGAAEHLCMLADYISTTPKSPEWMSVVQVKASFLMSLISASGLFLQKAQNALSRVTPTDLEYASTMVDSFHKGIHSQRHNCDSYKMFRLCFLAHPTEKEEAYSITGFGVFEEELEALNDPRSYSPMVAFAKNLGSLQKSCDVVDKACEGLKTLIQNVTAG